MLINNVLEYTKIVHYKLIDKERCNVQMVNINYQIIYIDYQIKIYFSLLYIKKARTKFRAFKFVMKV